jgi:hypothetical protein
MKFINQAKKFGRKVAYSSPLLMAGHSAMAAVDVTGVNTAIGNAETSAHSIGTTVIGVVAGLAVVGIVIGLVRKL